MKTRPKTLVLRAPGTNCDRETLAAFVRAGADAEALPWKRLVARPSLLGGASIVVLPGGFSFGDYLGAGRVWALEIELFLREEFGAFVRRGGLLLGICNGFQVLTRAGLLGAEAGEPVGFAPNASGRFECSWAALKVCSARSDFLRGAVSMRLPVAHGEGRFTASPAALGRLEASGAIALRYADPHPSGSAGGVAGLCDATGRVLGLMPHPERFVTELQGGAGSGRPCGATIFDNAVAAAARA
jgi:phosphoribosylformylglycinamidine synthase I